MIVILKLNKTKNHFFALFNTPNGSYDKKKWRDYQFFMPYKP